MFNNRFSKENEENKLRDQISGNLFDIHNVSIVGVKISEEQLKNKNIFRDKMHMFDRYHADQYWDSSIRCSDDLSL